MNTNEQESEAPKVFDVNIRSIDNGFVVTAGNHFMTQKGLIPASPPSTNYCEDLEAVKQCLARVWPREVKPLTLIEK